jgi:hypothetical protein
MDSSKRKPKINLAIPEQTLFQDEFVSLIKKAEEGPFYSHEEIWIK